MSCATEVTLKDRYIAYLQSVLPEYSYSRPHFNLADNGTLLYWNLEVAQPTSEQLEEIAVVKTCPSECIGCILRRLNTLEVKSAEFQDFADSFK